MQGAGGLDGELAAYGSWRWTEAAGSRHCHVFLAIVTLGLIAVVGATQKSNIRHRCLPAAAKWSVMMKLKHGHFRIPAAGLAHEGALPSITLTDCALHFRGYVT